MAIVERVEPRRLVIDLLPDGTPSRFYKEEMQFLSYEDGKDAAPPRVKQSDMKEEELKRIGAEMASIQLSNIIAMQGEDEEKKKTISTHEESLRSLGNAHVELQGKFDELSLKYRTLLSQLSRLSSVE
jgi:archaellum component FlaC